MDSESGNKNFPNFLRSRPINYALRATFGIVNINVVLFSRKYRKFSKEPSRWERGKWNKKKRVLGVGGGAAKLVLKWQTVNRKKISLCVLDVNRTYLQVRVLPR